MKIKSLLTIAVMLLFVASCEMTELDKQNNPNQATTENLDVDFLFNSIQTNFTDFYNTANVSASDVTRMEAMTGGNIYDNAFTPGTFSFMWNRAYQGVLVNVDLLIPAAEEKELFNYVGAAKLIRAYVLMTLVDYFGDVPLSEALQGTSNLSPLADPMADVYAAAGTDITEAIAAFQAGSTVTPNTDLYFDGDLDGWLKAAYAMQMKYELTTRLAGGSGTNFSAAATAWDALASGGDDDNFVYYYGSSRANPNARHPWYNNAYEGTNGRYQSNFYMWNFRDEGPTGVDDPRRRYYFYRQDWDINDDSKWNQFTLDFVLFDGTFTILNRPGHFPAGMPFGMATNGTTINTADGYYGRDHGNNDGIPPDGLLRVVYGAYPAGGKFDAGDPADPSTFGEVQNNGVDGATGVGIWPILTASNVYFMRAEAALAMATGEDARALFEMGVRESIAFTIGFSDDVGQGGGALQPDAAAIDAYVTASLALYDGAADPMDIVQYEYWKSLWGNSIDAYNAYRRTGSPSTLFPGNEMQPTRDADPGNFPRSMFYPATYVNLNGNADQKAITDQVFWDTNASFPE